MNQAETNGIEVLYVDEIYNNKRETKIIKTTAGKTILEISLENGIPHIHACGGNAKCTTCRVWVYAGEEHLSPKNELEERLSKKKGFRRQERLACQTKVYGNIKIKRIVKDEVDSDIVLSYYRSGKEQALAVLFADIRDFTSFTERHLAFDVVYVLNRFYKKMGDAILNNEGYLDKFMGDGILALFGIDSWDNQKKCENAFSSAIEMLKGLEEINQYLKTNYDEEIRIGIGLHFGTVIIGDLGHPEKMQLTAIGDTINYTSRLEKLTKQIQVPVLVSEEFAKVLNRPEIIEKEYVVQIRGKTGNYKVYSVNTQKKTYASIRNLIKQHLSKSLAPSVLRLVFHDVMSGGSFTSNFHDDYNIELELKKPINKNLESSVDFIKKIKNLIKDEPYSYRDILYLAGAVAVEITRGPFINIVVPMFSDRGFYEVGIPDENETFESFYKKFQQLNLTKQDMVALMGAHTLGKANGKPFTENLFTFNNEYFRRLIFYRDDPQLNSLLPTDKELLKDKECRKYVEIYAFSQERFFKDFSEAYIKLIQFGY
ncbi:MAG: 2Fe-2S iron-sulfur cluster-binding protein [Leptospiraceae bacterium]|nr:2Fe-2S iron-sulfur cluster-binding protein [Leptospiraceae bacterium]